MQIPATLEAKTQRILDLLNRRPSKDAVRYVRLTSTRDIVPNVSNARIVLKNPLGRRERIAVATTIRAAE
jgi:hypothetical protein